jgi:F-type H+-transporting ATPase subunit delta
MATQSLPEKDRRMVLSLARMAVAAGAAALQEVPPALERVLAGRNLAARRAFVTAFLKAYQRQVAAVTLVVEHAGALDAASGAELQAEFSRRSGRDLQLETRPNPELIAGLRLRLGDDVYDASVAGRLHQLANAIH